MQLVPLVLFVAVHLKNFFLLPSCHLTLMSFCTQGLPGIAESTFQKAKENLLMNWTLFPSSYLIHNEYGSNLIKFLSLLG